MLRRIQVKQTAVPPRASVGECSKVAVFPAATCLYKKEARRIDMGPCAPVCVWSLFGTHNLKVVHSNLIWLPSFVGRVNQVESPRSRFLPAAQDRMMRSAIIAMRAMDPPTIRNVRPCRPLSRSRPVDHLVSVRCCSTWPCNLALVGSPLGWVRGPRRAKSAARRRCA